DVRRHRLGIVGKHSVQNRKTDAGTFRHRHRQLRAWAAVLEADGGNAGGVPCVIREVTPELSEGSGQGKQAGRARTRVDDVAHISGVVVQVPLELVNRSAQYPFDHVADPLQRKDAIASRNVTSLPSQHVAAGATAAPSRRGAVLNPRGRNGGREVSL